MLAVLKEKPISNNIRIKKVEKPLVADGDLLVRVEMVGLCGSDLHSYHWTKDYEQRLGQFLPIIIGHEFVGIVEDVGAGVDNFEPVDKIVAMPGEFCGTCYCCENGHNGLCLNRKTLGVQYNGAMAEYTVVPSENCFKLPGNCSSEIGALMEPITIAYNAVVKADSMLGKDVVVIGPGALGYFIALFCYLGGASNIVVSGLPKDEYRMEIIKESIDQVRTVNSMNLLESEVRGFSKGGADVVFEVSGFKGALDQCIRLAKKRGEIILIGLTPDAITANINTIIRNEISVKGTHAGSKFLWDRVINYLSSLDQKALGKFEKVVTHKYPLSEAKDAFEASEKGLVLKALLLP